MKRFAVYCGSKIGSKEIYANTAIQLGEYFVENNLGVVYGGGSTGIMGTVARTVMEAGGNVIGVIPTFLEDKEVSNSNLSELHIVKDMHIRKAKMMDFADGFIALPGGPGTLEELYEVITWKQLKLHNKPIIIFNIDGYYEPLKQMSKDMADSEFMAREDIELFTFVESVEAFDELRKTIGI